MRNRISSGSVAASPGAEGASAPSLRPARVPSQTWLRRPADPALSFRHLQKWPLRLRCKRREMARIEQRNLVARCRRKRSRRRFQGLLLSALCRTLGGAKGEIRIGGSAARLGHIGGSLPAKSGSIIACASRIICRNDSSAINARAGNQPVLDRRSDGIPCRLASLQSQAFQRLQCRLARCRAPAC